MTEQLHFDDMLEYIGVIYRVNSRKKQAWYIVNEKIHGRFYFEPFDFEPSLGETVLLKLSKLPADDKHLFKVLGVEQTNQKPYANLLRQGKGKFFQKPNRSFGLVGKFLILPNVLENQELKNGDTLFFTAVKSLNEKKQKWEWKVIKIKKIDY